MEGTAHVIEQLGLAHKAACAEVERLQNEVDQLRKIILAIGENGASEGGRG